MTIKRSKHHRRKDTVIEHRMSPGSSPGTILVDPQAPRPIVRVIAYGPDTITEQEIQDVQAIRGYIDKWPVMWVNIDGLGDAATITKIGEIFNLHRLALEDVVSMHQRAKVELYDSYYFIVGRMVNPGERMETEQLSMFLGRNFVLTFQEHPGDCFDPVRARIRKAGGMIRQAGPDYLAYALLDALIDDYFPVLEKYGEKLEVLEDEVILAPDKRFITQIHEAKRDLLALRRAIWPLREAVGALQRERNPLITDETRIYIRDCYDHTIQIIDLLENYRDLASSLMEVYLSSVSNKLNEIMKLLTIFTAVFIPLTYISSIYGMNFKNMPELSWPWGYGFSWGLMIAVALIMLSYFRRKGWL